jgi:energy-coupling factor transporter ATP-binding protein EcfA2
MIRAHFTNLTFANGLAVELQANSILVILGPNNSGKSAALADIKGLLNDEPHKQLVITDGTLHRDTPLDVIKEIFAPALDGGGAYRFPGFAFHETAFETWWTDDHRSVGGFLSKQLISDLTTRARLADCDPAPAFDARVPFAADHPFQHMYRRPELEAATSSAFREAFKQDLILHRSGGSFIPAYVGVRPVLRKGEDRISSSYIDRVEKLSKLELQGDGIRSFVSILSRVLTEDRSIQIIDEPEAFLHPPQARMIAEHVARHGGGRQTIVATHSSDIVQGLLSGHADRVSVVRLTRRNLSPTASYLPPAEIAALWRDPILRFSNVLDGLFHDAVIVSEADADCRFYEAVANVTVDVEQRPDIHYTYSGGKHRIPVVVAALVGLKVPVVTVADFDLLNDEQPLHRVVEAHGGAWDLIEADWREVKRAVEAKEAFLGGDQFRKDVQVLLKGYGNGVAVPKEVLRQIKTLARRASPWDNIKSSGLAAIASGAPTVAAKRLLEALRQIGIFVAPSGEMEGFCRSIGGHGPRWVEEALKRDLRTDSEFDDARKFASSIISHLNDRLSAAAKADEPDVVSVV